jgi:hypothetical protein
MSDCGFCLSNEADGSNEFYDADIITARKEHRCSECHRPILPKQQYEYASGKYDGDFFTVKTCLDCMNIRDGLSCGGGYVHGELWTDMNDYGFERITTGCIAKVETASAKAYLIERWNAWKFSLPNGSKP